MCIVEITEIAAQSGNLIAGVLSLNQKKAEGMYKTQQIINQGKEAENNAAMIRQESIETARRQKLNSILNMAKTKTNAAANNLALSSETVLNLEQDDIMQGNLNASATLKNSEEKAKRYINSANMFYQNASLNSLQVKRNYARDIYSLGMNSAMKIAQIFI